MGINLSGKVGAITGAASGIGLACAKTMLKNGMIVVLIDRDEHRLKNICAELGPKAHALRMDILDASAVSSMLPKILELAGDPA